ncbi:MAG: endonuclease III domain-containing protein [Promethearchaeota archaeon]
MKKDVENAITFLEKIREFLKKLEKLTLLGEIADNAQKRGRIVDPFRILISTVLSVRNRDESTAVAMQQLFEKAKYDSPKKIANAKTEELEILIKKSGFYRTKSKRIKDISQILLDQYAGKVPQEIDKLLELPGVGRKVANCVRVFAFNIDCIPVDTHVHRISNRMGIVSTKRPDQTELALKKVYPKKYWKLINESFVLFGKNICKPLFPRCNECPIETECPKLIILPKKKKKSIK